MNWTLIGLVSATAFCGLLFALVLGRSVLTALSSLNGWLRTSPLHAVVLVPLVGLLVAYAGTKPTPPPTPVEPVPEEVEPEEPPAPPEPEEPPAPPEPPAPQEPEEPDEPQEPEEPAGATVGEYGRWALADLGVELPAAGTVYTVKAYGLPSGLKLKYNKAQKDKKGKVLVKAKTEWWIEGVPTEPREGSERPAYVAVTVGGQTTWQPIALPVRAQEVTDLGTLALGETVERTGWLKGVTGEWTVSGLPNGLKYTAKALYADKKKTRVSHAADSVYGKTTKAGLFSITAKKKVGSCHETLKYRVTVEPKAADADVFAFALSNRASVVAVAETWSLSDDVGEMSSVSGLPKGLKFDSKRQKIAGTPSKAGTFVTTFKKKVGKATKSAQVLWTVEPNPVGPKVAFNLSGGVILNRSAGSDYAKGSAAAMTFDVTPGASVSASGLPKGLSLKRVADGAWTIVGKTTEAGTYYVTVTAKLNGNAVTQGVAVKVGAHPLAGDYSGDVWLADGSYGGTVKLTVGSTGKVSLSLVERGVKTSASLAGVMALEESLDEPNVGRWKCVFALKANKKKALPKRTLELVFARTSGEWQLPLCDTANSSCRTSASEDFAQVVPHRALSKAEIAARIAAGRIPELLSVETQAILADGSGDSPDGTVDVSATYKPSSATYAVTGRLPDGKAFSASSPVLWRGFDDLAHDAIGLGTLVVSDGAGVKYCLVVR